MMAIILYRVSGTDIRNLFIKKTHNIKEKQPETLEMRIPDSVFKSTRVEIDKGI